MGLGARKIDRNPIAWGCGLCGMFIPLWRARIHKEIKEGVNLIKSPFSVDFPEENGIDLRPGTCAVVILYAVLYAEYERRVQVIERA